MQRFIHAADEDGGVVVEVEFRGQAVAGGRDVVHDQNLPTQTERLARRLFLHDVDLDAHPKGRALAHFAAHTDFAAHQFRQALDDGQP